MNKRIVIIGGGIVGLGCGVKLIEHFKGSVEITIITENISPNTTGNIAAGLWTVFMLSTTSREKIKKWGKETFKLYDNFWKSGQSFETGVTLLPLIRLTRFDDSELIAFGDITYGFQKLSSSELDKFSKEHDTVYNNGARYVTYSCETLRLLTHLMKRFLAAGGLLIRKRIESFDEIPTRDSITNDGYDIIINCTGVMAKQLAKDDDVKPVRGQLVRVNAPWVTKAMVTDYNYIIPNIGVIVLGFTKQVNDYNTNIAIKDRQSILEGCTQLIHTLKSSDFIGEMTGLRPGRSDVRLEEEMYRKQNGDIVKIIHNYGHGGSGFTLFWGCASDVLDLVIKSMNNTNISKL